MLLFKCSQGSNTKGENNMTMTQTKISGEELQKELDNFYCTEKYYKNYLLSFNYTDGVKFFAERAGAYWFLQEVNGGYYKLRCKGLGDFLSITAKSHKGKCDIIFTDGNCKQLYKRHIAHTDMPEGD